MTPCVRRSIERLEAFDEQRFGERLFARDATLWKDDPQHREIIGNALGWPAASPTAHAGQAAATSSGFAAQVAADGYTHALLLGMGGSSLGPRGPAPKSSARPDGLPAVRVLRLAPILRRCAPIEKEIDPAAPCSSSSASPAARPRRRLPRLLLRGQGAAGRLQAAALLHRHHRSGHLAGEGAGGDGFRDVFLNRPDIGGRYSALSLSAWCRPR